ncbi:glycosyltransferase family 39 protein [Fortiea sp. LEGE XX443]|uniref:glycosyltransferase family 39 protein n=1 Tax=Fortiea sp. LEGE XX443 TaxID=1828611 RepID=UPI001881893E|nr:glycosyltransferase family 39 protein [Fortiea sp. LEGE XX443]MBE9006389.1 glycosyltransferase family 39 protein [Fortiea sp. LEGE XX443]
MQQNTLMQSWLRFLTIVLLVMAILFRFSNINSKVYSHDETYTSLRISGYTVEEVKQQLFNGRVITPESFAQFQNINQPKELSDTIMSLAKEDPQHTPLYFVLARFWLGIFGNSVTAIRSLSACISLLVFPSIYWLCRELFDVPTLIPGLAIALTAVSPVYLIYATEAQEYILWLVTIIVCSASLIRAMGLESKYEDELAKRQQTSDSFTTWSIYTVTLVLSLYTSLWSVFVAIAHGVYVIISERLRLTKTVRAYLLASIVAFFAFIPWLIIILAKFFQFLLSNNGTSTQFFILPLLPFSLRQVSRIFIDLDLGLNNALGYFIWTFFVILVGCAIYLLCRTTNYKIWLFILSLIVVPALPLVLPALTTGGIKLGSEPYFLPSYLGIQIAVAYLLATQIYSGRLPRRRIWQTIMVLLIIGGLISSRVYYQAETWWNKGVSYHNHQVAQIINRSARPLLISDAEGINYGNVFSLSYLVEPRVQFKLLKNQNTSNISDSYTQVFLLNLTDTWRQKIATQNQSKINLVYRDEYYSLWKLLKPRNSRQSSILQRNQFSGS